MRYFAFLLLLIAPLVSQPAAALADAEDEARVFVQNIADGVISVLQNPDSDLKSRKQAFRTLLSENADLKAIGKFTVGRAWREASEDDQAAFLSAFEAYVASTFAEQLDAYSGEQLNLGRTVNLGKKGLIVYSKVQQSSGQPPLSIDWRVKDRSGTLKIIDITVENVSMALTQRSEFKAVLDRNGGKLGSVTAELQARTGV